MVGLNIEKQFIGNNLLLYKYIRGSQVYGTNDENSDTDIGGVYMCHNNDLLDLKINYKSEIDHGDECYWELNRFMELLTKSNPAVLEALFIPEDKILYEHPIMTKIKNCRDYFVTKECFKPFGGYAVSQIKKAQGQNKKIHWTNTVRKTPLDFCFTFKEQGSIPIEVWLKDRGLKQEHCGLVNIPNMPNMYAVHYDFGQHIKMEWIAREHFINEIYHKDPFIQFIFKFMIPSDIRYEMKYEWIMGKLYDKLKPYGKHHGIVSENGNEVRYSEIQFKSYPICYMSYNKQGYEIHCKMYKEYKEWEENRNPVRYENNLKGDTQDISRYYDSKNIMHCFRLIKMCIEIAKGEGVNLYRKDAEFLKDIKNRKYTYEELMSMLTELKSEMDSEIKKSTLPETVNIGFVNNLLIDIRNGLF